MKYSDEYMILRIFALTLLAFCSISFRLVAEDASAQPVKLGIDVLIDSNFEQISGKRIAILTNNTGRSQSGELTAEILLKSKKCTVVSFLTPEHGFWTTIPAGESVKSHELFGLPAYSLYGDNRRPTRSQLADIDAVVVDFQDIGIRSYTYISTMLKVMSACAEYGISVIVLDRPNPLGGEIVDGNTVEPGMESFIGIAPISYIHGCTIGELAMMFNEEEWLEKGSDGIVRRCSLSVVSMQGWHRKMAWEDTHLMWFPTSPNIPTVDAARGAAMLGLFGELGTVAIGIGTTLPFQYLGNPDFDEEAVLHTLLEESHPGLYLSPARFRPTLGKNSAKDCSGLLIRFTEDRYNFAPFTEGVKLLLAARRHYPAIFAKAQISEKAEQMFSKAAGTKELINALKKKATDAYILKIANKGLAEFKVLRNKYLLYL